jgi:NAD-dependent SIR2 family protein deacetylase
LTFRFIRICPSNGRHEFQCTTCHRFFWFLPGRELDENENPTWKHCPHCAGWRKVLEPQPAQNAENPQP